LTNALNWISNDSLQQAEQTEQAILTFIEKASFDPERFPPDKYKRNNPGSFRAFETHSFRISFLFTEEEIHVLRVRHVRQKPLQY
jgi:plasmid stabilization system protein ParE